MSVCDDVKRELPEATGWGISLKLRARSPASNDVIFPCLLSVAARSKPLHSHLTHDEYN